MPIKIIHTVFGEVQVVLPGLSSHSGYIAKCQFHDGTPAIDAIESMILAHACTGVDIESEFYIAGVNTTLEAIANNVDEPEEEIARAPVVYPTIKPGMRIRWNDPDGGACTKEGIVATCTTPNEEETIVITMEDGWACECMLRELEVMVEPELVITGFNETEMIEIMEIARLALQDTVGVFEEVAETTDLSDDYLIALRDKLTAAMDSDVRIFKPKTD